MENLLQRIWGFLHTDLWRMRLDDMPRPRSFWLRLLRIATLSFREFGRDRCSLHASALTFYTLLAVVPVAAMAFGVAKGFGWQEFLERELRENFPLPAIVRPAGPPAQPALLGATAGTTDTLALAAANAEALHGAAATSASATGLAAAAATTATAITGHEASAARPAGGEQQDIVSWIITFANNALANVHGGLVAGIGVLLLLWVVIKVLGNIETSFNDIWGIRRPRHVGRKLSDYTFFALFGPILAVFALSLTATLTGKITAIVEGMRLWWGIARLTELGLRLGPLVLVWLLFLTTYLFLPNTKVHWRAGLVGAVVGGTLYQFVEWIYIRFQVGVANYSVVYGSFAAVPLFLVWLQTSWLIVLYGAEVSFAWQNVDTYEFEPDCRTASPAFRRLVAVAIAQVCVDCFVHESAPPTAAAIAKRLGAPLRLVNELLFALADARVLAEVRNSDDKQVGYQPAGPTARMTVADVTMRLLHQGTADAPLHRTPVLERLSATLAAFERRMTECPENVRLLDL